jgi:hypothetical protein
MRWSAALLLTMTLAATAQSPKVAKDDPPETVVATFYLKPDKVEDFFKMMPEYWQLLRKLDLVEPGAWSSAAGRGCGRQTYRDADLHLEALFDAGQCPA